MRTSTKHSILFCIAAAVIAGVYIQGPIPQDPSYHLFADKRTVFGVRDFWNVITNVPFVVIGFMGMFLPALRETPGGLPGLRTEYFAFFLGVFATGFGSMYYHYQPGNETLFWDRLPMAISFAAFFCAIAGEHISISAGRKLFWPVAALAAGSVFYWYATEKSGSGDLRLYAVVQYLPVLVVPVIISLFKSNLAPSAYLWTVIGLYGAAKIAEVLDKPIYAAGHIWSGHSIKHLTAALGAYVFYRALRRRKTI